MEFLSFLAENIPVIWKNNKKRIFYTKNNKFRNGNITIPQSFSL